MAFDRAGRWYDAELRSEQTSMNQRGEKNSNAKLTAADVELVKHLCKTNTQRQVADAFGISQPQVSRIVNGKRWASENR